MGTVMRSHIEDWLQFTVGTGASATTYTCKLGEGFSALDENLNAKTSSKQYISDTDATKSVTGYESSFSFTTDFFDSELATRHLYNIARNREVNNAQMTYYRLEKYKGDQKSGAEDWKYYGRKFTVTAEITSMTGGGGEAVSITGSLNPVGNGKHGTLTCTHTGSGASIEYNYAWADVTWDEATDMAREITA